jgi:hypothetical protein
MEVGTFESMCDALQRLALQGEETVAAAVYVLLGHSVYNTSCAWAWRKI